MIIKPYKDLYNEVTPTNPTDWLTEYRDGDDIDTYMSTRYACVPLSIDPEDYFREITDEQDAEYKAQMDTKQPKTPKEEPAIHIPVHRGIIID